MSFFCAVDPVAIAMCAAAVSDGAIVMFCSAQNPFFFSSPIPELSDIAPDFNRSFTMRGVAPSSEITIILGGAANAGMAITIASDTVASEARDERTRARISRKRVSFMNTDPPEAKRYAASVKKKLQVSKKQINKFALRNTQIKKVAGPCMSTSSQVV